VKAILSVGEVKEIWGRSARPSPQIYPILRQGVLYAPCLKPTLQGYLSLRGGFYILAVFRGLASEEAKPSFLEPLNGL